MNTTGEDSEKKTVGWTDGAQDEGVGSFDDYLRQDREVLESRLVAPDKLTHRRCMHRMNNVNTSLRLEGNN
jgi:hypothetical protein